MSTNTTAAKNGIFDPAAALTELRAIADPAALSDSEIDVHIETIEKLLDLYPAARQPYYDRMDSIATFNFPGDAVRLIDQSR